MICICVLSVGGAQVDAMHGMLTQWSFNTTVSNTIPFLETPVKAILYKTKVSAGMFVWVQPFETDLWMAIIAFVFFSGFWIILLNYLTARTSEDPAAAEEVRAACLDLSSHSSSCHGRLKCQSYLHWAQPCTMRGLFSWQER